jgi:hypothetical protein
MFRTINIVESILWAGFWVFAIVAITNAAIHIYRKRGSSYELKEKMALVFASLSMAMYALMYIYIIFRHKLLFGYSFYLNFTYRLIGAIVSVTALLFSMSTSPQLSRAAGIIISIAILYGFCNDLVSIPFADIIELLIFITIYAVGIFALAKRYLRHESTT